jgi:hypothetical protein
LGLIMIKDPKVDTPPFGRSGGDSFAPFCSHRSCARSRIHSACERLPRTLLPSSPPSLSLGASHASVGKPGTSYICTGLDSRSQFPISVPDFGRVGLRVTFEKTRKSSRQSPRSAVPLPTVTGQGYPDQQAVHWHTRQESHKSCLGLNPSCSGA